MFLYRLYNHENVFVSDCQANSYGEAAEIMKANDLDKIFIVEEDNHEIECGMAWIEEMLRE